MRAYCHERESNRQFRIDRIEDVIDFRTGEVLSNTGIAFFEQFTVNHSQQSKLGWGLSVRRKADLVAGLNALVFLARCDDEFHPAEREAIERFIESFWLRMELDGEPPFDDILAHVSRMTPDPEMFYLALTRCNEHPQLCRLIRIHIQSVIDADGIIKPQEFYWGEAVDEYFRSLQI